MGVGNVYPGVTPAIHYFNIFTLMEHIALEDHSVHVLQFIADLLHPPGIPMMSSMVQLTGDSQYLKYRGDEEHCAQLSSYMAQCIGKGVVLSFGKVILQLVIILALTWSMFQGLEDLFSHLQNFPNSWSTPE